MFSVDYSKKAEKFLAHSDKILAKRITNKIEQLMVNPIGHDTTRVEGYKEKIFRVRVGDYRILYEVDYQLNEIGVIKIDKREKVYD